MEKTKVNLWNNADRYCYVTVGEVFDGYVYHWEDGTYSERRLMVTDFDWDQPRTVIDAQTGEAIPVDCVYQYKSDLLAARKVFGVKVPQSDLLARMQIPQGLYDEVLQVKDKIRELQGLGVNFALDNTNGDLSAWFSDGEIDEIDGWRPDVAIASLSEAFLVATGIHSAYDDMCYIRFND